MTRLRVGWVFLAAALAASGGVAAGAGEGWFPHRLHVEEVGAVCTDCHSGAAASTAASDDNLPRAGVCLGCHAGEETICPPVCGQDPKAAVPGRHRGRNLIFSHRRHVDQGLECGDCHQLAADGEAAVGRGEAGKPVRSSLMPAMSGCLECHGADTGCRQCHARTDGSGFRPSSHDAFWLEKHRLATRSERTACAGCHTEASCQQCHHGDAENSYHDATFRVTHGLEARLAPVSCQRCHRTNTCQSCHARLGGG